MKLQTMFKNISTGAYAENRVTPVTLEVPGQTHHDAMIDPHNRRLKLYGLHAGNAEPRFLADLKDIPTGNLNISKIIAYARQGGESRWQNTGFVKEGLIRGFFADHADAHIWSFFKRPERARKSQTVGSRMEHEPPRDILPPRLPEGFTSRIAVLKDASAISALLQRTFPEYPSPLDKVTIRAAIRNRTSLFRIVLGPGRTLAAVMSAEIDAKRFSAEMTDCATQPEYRGKGLMHHLLAHLERDIHALCGVKDLYTLARAAQPAVNRVFFKSHYEHTGCLVNNCRMPTGWESVNIWCKTIQ